MWFEMMLGVAFFQAVPAICWVLAYFWDEGRIHHTSLWFELWVNYRSWRMRP